MQDVVNINFRTDARLKEEFASVVEAMGLTVTTAFNAFMRATVREQAMPFRLRATSKLTGDAREARALLNGREFVTPDDVSSLAGPVLTHRLILNQKSRHAGLSAADLVAAIVKKTRVPV